MLDGNEVLVRAAEAARADAIDTKRPLIRELLPAPTFPRDALAPLTSAADALHDRTQAPYAMCAQSALAAATLAVQAHRDVELPGAGRRPLTGIFASIAESGERKTTCDRIALAAMYRFEENLRARHDPAWAAYVADREAWKAASEAAKKKDRGDRAAIRAALEAVGPEPKPPPHPMILVADPTPEALVMHLADSRPWCGLFTDEGGSLIGGHAMNDDNRMRTGALLNALWDGAPIRRVRVTTGKTFLPGRRCSAHVMMQPAVASAFFGDPTLGGIGTLARVLTVAPDSTAGTRLFREPCDASNAALANYSGRIGELLARTPRMTDDGSLDPPALTLTADARALFVGFHDHAERELRDGGILAPIRAFGSKLAEHAGRLAATLAVYADPDILDVSGEHMAAGIALAGHFAAELLRLGEAAQVAPELRAAQRLLAWWQGRSDPCCHLADIYQRGPYRLRDAKSARPIVAILEEHGWITALPPGTVLDGMGRREAWRLVP